MIKAYMVHNICFLILILTHNTTALHASADELNTQLQKHETSTQC